MGITAMVRTLAAMTGPSITGVLAGGDRFWIAFIMAGVCRLMYDFGLYAMFINMKLYQHEDGGDCAQVSSPPGRISDEEDMTELQDLVGSDKFDKSSTPGSSSESSKSPSLIPQHDPQVRRRSPSPLAKTMN